MDRSPISDQLADESFTVYDHPKVMIFKKSADFSLDQVRAILESADLTQILDQSPMAVTIMPTGLRLPPDRLAAQKAGGTWYQMFDFQSFLNQNQVVWRAGLVFGSCCCWAGWCSRWYSSRAGGCRIAAIHWPG